jgi:DNA modification methylase
MSDRGLGVMARRSREIRRQKALDLFNRSPSGVEPQTIYCGDNLRELRNFADQSFDLIYIDPPFNSNRNYEVFWGEARETRAFEDRHASTEAYIEFMRPRCVELARVLKKTGSFYYHCDWHAGHYVKVMLDQIFGENNFLNEIIWKRTSSHSGSRRFGPIHDTIFFYGASSEYTWNHQYLEMSTNRRTRHDLVADGSGRLYRTSDLTGSGTRNGDSGKPWRDYDPTRKGRHWGIPRELAASLGIEGLSLHDKLDALDAEGLVYHPGGGSLPRYKVPVEGDSGMTLGSVWTDIPPINSQAEERVGYPTQKPLQLLERIIRASSNQGDLVLDAFCGCGTALVAAERSGRQWVGIDMSPTACRVMADRLEQDCGLIEGQDFTVRNDMMLDIETLRRIPPFEFENWAVVSLGGTPNKAKVGDKGIDGKLFPASVIPEKMKNGFDFMDHWYPIQVKQKDKAGRPDIDAFETAMRRARRHKGFFVSFDYTQDAEDEIRHCFFREGLEIVPVRVRQILAGEIPVSLS